MKNYKMPKLNVYEVEAKFAFAAISGLEDNGNIELDGKEESGDIIFG